MGGKYSCDSSNKEINSCKYEYFAGFWGVGIAVWGIIMWLLLIYVYGKSFLGKPFMLFLYGLIFTLSGVFMTAVSFDAVTITNKVKDCPECSKCTK